MQLRDITGLSFGRLTAKSIHIGPSPGGKRRAIRWDCVCSCGMETVVVSGNLINGHTKSCGCLRTETSSTTHWVHGDERKGRRAKEMSVFTSLKSRCTDKNNCRYSSYGGRGITVCERWLGQNGYINFLSDMGRCPPDKTSIDRIDGNLGYSKENCRWADKYEQANNRMTNHRLTLNGETMNLGQWAAKLGINPATLRNRIKKGWSTERAFFTSTHKPCLSHLA